MKPLALITVIAVVILAAASFALVGKFADAKAYAIRRQADSRATIAAEATRHNAVINRLDEQQAAENFGAKVAAWNVIYYTGGIAIAVFAVAVVTAGSIYSVGVSKAQVRQAQIQAAAIYPDSKTGRMPVIQLADSNGQLLLADLQTGGLIDATATRIAPHDRLVEAEAAARIVAALANHPDYQDIAAGLPVKVVSSAIPKLMKLEKSSS